MARLDLTWPDNPLAEMPAQKAVRKNKSCNKVNNYGKAIHRRSLTVTLNCEYPLPCEIVVQIAPSVPIAQVSASWSLGGHVRTLA